MMPPAVGDPTLTLKNFQSDAEGLTLRARNKPVECHSQHIHIGETLPHMPGERHSLAASVWSAANVTLALGWIDALAREPCERACIYKIHLQAPTAAFHHVLGVEK